MKQNIKNYLKLGILFFGITLLFFQCQKVDDSQTSISNQKATLKISVVHGDDHFAKSHPVIYNKLKKANQDKVLARETQYSNDYDFYFNLDNIQIIEKPNYTQYTIVVESTIENYDLLNYILILYNDGEEYQYLATYPRVETTEGLEINHYSATLERLNGQSLLARGINMSDCADGNEPQLVDVTQTYSCTEITCTGRNHTSEQECFCGQYVNGMYYDCQRAYLDCGWSSVNNWSCTGGGSPGGPGSSTSGSNSGSNDNTIETVALNDSRNLVDNCKELNKLTSPPAYPVNNTYTMIGNPYNIYGLNTNIRLAIINADQELDNDKETGFGLYNRGNFIATGPYAHYVPANNDTHSVNFQPIPYLFGTIHTHPKNSTHRNWIPMFSLDDIYSVLDIRNQYAIDQFYNNLNTAGDALFTSILIVDQGNEVKTYAIKIDDITKFQKLQDIKNDVDDANGDGIDEYYNLNEEMEKTYIQDANNVSGSAEQYQKVFLKFISDNDLGISLYEMDQTNAGTPQVQENWKKLTLNSFDTIISTPCEN